jgi:hypothetical protein
MMLSSAATSLLLCFFCTALERHSWHQDCPLAGPPSATAHSPQIGFPHPAQLATASTLA